MLHSKNIPRVFVGCCVLSRLWSGNYNIDVKLLCRFVFSRFCDNYENKSQTIVIHKAVFVLLDSTTIFVPATESTPTLQYPRWFHRIDCGNLGQWCDAIFVERGHLSYIPGSSLPQHETQCISNAQQTQHSLYEYGKSFKRRPGYCLWNIHGGRQWAVLTRRYHMGQNCLFICFYGQIGFMG